MTALLEMVSLPEIHQYVGGKATNNNDFIVSLNYKWSPELLNHPFRVEGAAFVFCTNGEATISTSLRKLKMHKGKIMLYGRESIVELLHISEDYRCDILFFSSTFISDTLLDLKSVIPIFKYITENLSELISLDADESVIIKRFYELIYLSMDLSPSVVRDLMSAYMRTLGDMYTLRLTTNPKVKTRQEEYLESFLHKIAKDHKKERSVKYYADQLYITPKYLSTVIKEISGKSAASWINDFVIQEAKMLLRFTGKSIQEITYELNFSTQSFFGKYFKRHTGMSPSEYRVSE